MTDASVEKQFVERMRELLVNLPYDMKVLFEAMTDENLPTEARQLATSAVVYCLSPSDPIPDTMGLIGFVDDVVVTRVALTKMLEMAADPMGTYPKRFPEQFDALDRDVALFRAYLGDTMRWVDWHIEKNDQVKYKGKRISDYLTDDEASQRLYEEGLAFTTDYEIDDEAAAKLASGKPVLDAFRKVYDVERSRRNQANA